MKMGESKRKQVRKPEAADIFDSSFCFFRREASWIRIRCVFGELKEEAKLKAQRNGALIAQLCLLDCVDKLSERLQPAPPSEILRLVSR